MYDALSCAYLSFSTNSSPSNQPSKLDSPANRSTTSFPFSIFDANSDRSPTSQRFFYLTIVCLPTELIPITLDELFAETKLRKGHALLREVDIENCPGKGCLPVAEADSVGGVDRQFGWDLLSGCGDECTRSCAEQLLEATLKTRSLVSFPHLISSLPRNVI
jgi:hypothetical protein